MMASMPAAEVSPSRRRLPAGALRRRQLAASAWVYLAFLAVATIMAGDIRSRLYSELEGRPTRETVPHLFRSAQSGRMGRRRSLGTGRCG
ncbi:hypothetical protein Q1M64_03285 (plasmid) [Sinorhizobium meliloti]|nr:hypothetical protein Q1M64_03285 [Sinorhizobium meliloti]